MTNLLGIIALSVVAKNTGDLSDLHAPCEWHIDENEDVYGDPAASFYDRISSDLEPYVLYFHQEGCQKTPGYGMIWNM